MSTIYTRESWLRRAVEVFRPRFAEIELPLPANVHVSVGFSLGARAENSKILGCCFTREASEDGVNHIFISPESGDPVEVLETLLHELIHAADNCQSGHKGIFADAAKLLGFEGPMTATPASIELTAELMCIAEALGDYPHGALIVPRPGRKPVQVIVNGAPVPSGTKVHSGPKTQTTRMLKLACVNSECVAVGYTVRTTAKWLAMGAPKCPMGCTMHDA
jgi:hypothetical protein